MLDLGRDVASRLQLPTVIELVGDVGAGKTTFTRGLALGLGISEPVTSPSFMISKRYAFAGGELAHYDFYRLDDPGIMSEELDESISQPNTVTVVEWADSVASLLPPKHLRISFMLNDDESRTVEISEEQHD